MFGSYHQLKTLTARKRLLVAESELNRAQLAHDVNALAAGVHALTARTAALRSVASSAAGLMAGLAASRRDPQRAFAGPKRSRLQTVLHCAGFASSLWLAWRTRGSSPQK